MSSPFQHPENEVPQVAWARSAQISYYKEHQKIIFEVVLQRDGKAVIGRSLTLFLDRVEKGDSLHQLLRTVVDDIETRKGIPEVVRSPSVALNSSTV